MFGKRVIRRGISVVSALALMVSMATSPLRPSYYAYRVASLRHSHVATSLVLAFNVRHSQSSSAKTVTVRSVVVKAVRSEDKKAVGDDACVADQSYALPLSRCLPTVLPLATFAYFHATSPLRC